MMTSIALVVSSVLTLSACSKREEADASASQSAVPFVGTFSDGKLTVDLSAANGGYSGTITLGDQKYPATAQLQGQTLQGTFDAGSNHFPFTATMDGDGLILVSSDTTYRTHRIASAVNPLAATQGGNAPAGYGVINATEYGQVLGTDKPKATDIQSGLESTFPDLAQFFGQRPKIGGAYEDAKNQQSGGATFTATYNGQAIRGIVSCKMVDHGATIVVIYCRVDAPAGAWRKLTAGPAALRPRRPPILRRRRTTARVCTITIFPMALAALVWPMGGRRRRNPASRRS